MLRQIILAATASLAGLLGVSSASAATSCGSFAPDVTFLVDGTSGCEIDPGVDNDNPEQQFLAADFFGYDDWKFDAKTNASSNGGIEEIDELGPNLFGLNIDGDVFGGTWSLSGVPASDVDLMLVFKGGNNKLPNALVAYELNDSSGSFVSPFFTKEGDFQDTPSEISHISLYYRIDGGGNPVVENPTAVPLPAAGWLLLAALGGLGALGRLGRRTAA